MAASEPITWKAILLLMAAQVAVNVTVTTGILKFHSQAPHKGAALAKDVEVLEQLSGQLGNLSQSNAGVLEANIGLRRDMDRVERAIGRLEEKLP